MHSEIHALLALLLSPGVGIAAARRALAVASAAGAPLGALLDMSARDLMTLAPPGMQGVAADVAKCEPAHRDRAERLLKRVYEAGAQAIAISDGDYPAALRSVLGDDAPPLVFVFGDPGILDTPSAAVVGARDPSAQGVKCAQACAVTFAREGIPVVSGGARGVDSAAHEAAVCFGGKTVVVLPQGLLTYRVPRVLFDALDAGRAVIFSEFAPDTDWETHAAVTRNATISALSRVVCVIEPKKEGGSIRTARCALAQQKRVLIAAAPGFESVARSLKTAGALDLVGEDGEVEREHLLALWRSAPHIARGQPTLF